MWPRMRLSRRLIAGAVIAVLIAAAGYWFLANGALGGDGMKKQTERREIAPRVLAYKAFDEALFENPEVKHRPLRILHEKVHTGTIKKLKELGYGGLVTNVEYQPLSMYLQVPDYWTMLKQNVRYAIEELGLRVWIYDELGWPSGGAGGLVLKERSELEAKGLAVIAQAAKGGDTVRIDHPVGHGDVVSAAAYRGTEQHFDIADSINLLPVLDANRALNWQAPEGQWVVFYFVEKPFYEGTHAVANWFQQRRYPNLLEKDTATTFIEKTHEQYREHLGDYFGNGIEAFFTDEPSLLGTYFDPPPVKPSVLDAPSPDIPLLKTLNWGNQVADEFRLRRGYDLIANLPYLVGGDGDQALKIRRDYYLTLSELLENHYFGALEQFGDTYGVASSGHLLLEENLYHQAIFSGNMLQLYKRMQIPGIDLLTSYPHVAKDWGVTVAKLASSAAMINGREHVMSEISSAFDAEDAGLTGRLGSIAVQYAYGVDTFNSYYLHETMSDEENRTFTSFIGRIGYMLDGGVDTSSVAVYYPIESVWAETLPPISLHAHDFAKEAVRLSDNFKKIAMRLVENQLNFHYVDSEAILKTDIGQSGLAAIGDLQFEVLVIPELAVIEVDVIDKLKQLADAGITLVIQSDGRSVTTLGDDKEQAKTAAFQQLTQHEHVVMARADKIASQVSQFIQPDLDVRKNPDDFIYRKQQFAESSAYLIVNVSDRVRRLNAMIADEGGQVKVWDPATGTVRPLSFTQKDGRLQIDIELAGWQTVIVTVEP